jgi:hypothetical protein
MYKNGFFPDEDYWYWLAAAGRMPHPDFDHGARRAIVQAQAGAHGNTILRVATAESEAKVSQALTQGTGWAHRISKPTEIPALPQIGPDGNTYLSAQLAAQVDIWRTWWRVDADIPQV